MAFNNRNDSDYNGEMMPTNSDSSAFIPNQRQPQQQQQQFAPPPNFNNGNGPTRAAPGNNEKNKARLSPAFSTTRPSITETNIEPQRYAPPNGPTEGATSPGNTNSWKNEARPATTVLTNMPSMSDMIAVEPPPFGQRGYTEGGYKLQNHHGGTSVASNTSPRMQHKRYSDGPLLNSPPWTSNNVVPGNDTSTTKQNEAATRLSPPFLNNNNNNNMPSMTGVIAVEPPPFNNGPTTTTKTATAAQPRNTKKNETRLSPTFLNNMPSDMVVVEPPPFDSRGRSEGGYKLQHLNNNHKSPTVSPKMQRKRYSDVPLKSLSPPRSPVWDSNFVKQPAAATTAESRQAERMNREYRKGRMGNNSNHSKNSSNHSNHNTNNNNVMNIPPPPSTEMFDSNHSAKMPYRAPSNAASSTISTGTSMTVLQQAKIDGARGSAGVRRATQRGTYAPGEVSPSRTSPVRSTTSGSLSPKSRSPTHQRGRRSPPHSLSPKGRISRNPTYNNNNNNHQREGPVMNNDDISIKRQVANTLGGQRGRERAEDRKVREWAQRNMDIGNNNNNNNNNTRTDGMKVLRVSKTARQSHVLMDEQDVEESRPSHDDDSDGQGQEVVAPGAFAYNQDEGFVRRTKGDITDEPSLGSCPANEDLSSRRGGEQLPRPPSAPFDPRQPPPVPGGSMPPGASYDPRPPRLSGDLDKKEDALEKESSTLGSWTRSKLISLGLLLVVVVGVIVGVVVAVSGGDGGGSGDNPTEPTAPPAPSTTAPELDTFAEWRERLKPWTEASVLMDESSPQFSAMVWLANEDKNDNNNNDDSIGNRYALATLFFSTGGWDAWKNAAGFLNPHLSECEWDFVTCKNNNEDNTNIITRLEIADKSLQGTLPDEFGILDNLQFLDLSENSLSGSISTKITNAWENLQELHLDSNTLTGLVPPIGPVMRKFMVKQNRFSGNLVLPPAMNISAIPLSEVDVAGNMLTGTLPEHLGDLLNLEELLLSNNRFNGALPEGKDWPALRALDCQVNSLTGTIPIADMSQLRVFLCGRNNFETNAISFDAFPEDMELIEFRSSNLISTLEGIGRFSALRLLALTDNELSGTIPPEIGDLSKLFQLALGRNFLSGSLPTELAALTGLGLLELNWNSLTGTIPTELSALTRLESASFEVNSFDEEADVEFLCSNVDDPGALILFGPDCQESTVCSCCQRC